MPNEHDDNPAPAPAGSGRHGPATSPRRISVRGWWQLLRRCVWRVFQDRLFGEAAAVAFYALLAIFPALAALVTLGGLFVAPAAAAGYLQGLAGTLPAGAADVAGDALGRIGDAEGGRAGLAAGLAATALWSATVAATQLFGALNVAYRTAERRGIVRLYATGLVFALGAMVFVALALGGVLAVPVVGGEGEAGGLLHRLRWPVLLVFAALGLALTYRHGPCHGPCHAVPRWRWVSWGSAVAAGIWLLGSAAVSWYIERVSGYDWLYGSIGSVLGLMLWAWISSAAVLVGAVLNAELEQQARPAAGPAAARR